MSRYVPGEPATDPLTDEWSGNLPPETRSFVGRHDELTRLHDLLDGEERRDGHGPRLVTLLGPGGVGKTRLAVRTARRLRSAYPDGTWLVELSPLYAAGLTGPDVIGLLAIEALRLDDQSARGAGQVLADWLADKRLLLVLDSCEHMLAECAAFAETLRAAPHVDVLATSRRRLGVPGERCLDVEPLPVGEPGAEGRDDAVALLADRAAAARPGFVLDGTGRSVAAGICRRLDGVPLAVELAAARLSALSLTELDRRLEAGLDLRSPLLTSEDVPAEDPPRHQALRTTIGWSHELCAPLERLLWARLSVFAGGFDTDAAQEVCAGGPLPAGQVPVLLDALADQSIVQRTGAAGDRFRMLDTVREYGADWLRELGEQDAVQQRHIAYYRRLARAGCAEWNTGRQAQWAERLRADHANLRSAVDRCLDGPDRHAALEFTGTTGFLWRHCGHVRDAMHRLDRLLADDLPPGPELLLAVWTRSAVALIQGDVDATELWAGRCAEAAGVRDDPDTGVLTAYLTGARLALLGRPDEAVATLTGAPHLPVRDDWFGSVQLQMRGSLAFALMGQGDFERARTEADGIRAECDRRGECWVRSTVDFVASQIDLAQGDIASAARNATRALDGYRLLHSYTSVVALSLDTLAFTEATAGDSHRAARLLGIAQRLWDRTGRAQLASAEFAAARQACERTIRARIGDQRYELAYAEGHSMSYEQGMSYATTAGPWPG
ncbi:hypothetical protein [Streptomyces sp. CC219B]|uniref:ATP-binding protein n=1 Tax=Streptomyces sp. CC219B TaxID=3044574 RepID=UPI0024A83260|nr:hypothetical protein [Streptomyces sp. CC219B]